MNTNTQLIDCDPDADMTVHVTWARFNRVVKAYCRNPAPDEFAAVKANVQIREGETFIDCSYDVLRTAFYEILEGVEDGVFGYRGKPFSSDPDSDAYDENWKDKIADKHSDFMFSGGLQVFGHHIDKTNYKFKGPELKKTAKKGGATKNPSPAGSGTSGTSSKNSSTKGAPTQNE